MVRRYLSQSDARNVERNVARTFCAKATRNTATIAICTAISMQPVADMVNTADMAPWEVCALCHGANGISPMARFPHLAGQKSDYLRRQLLDFRSGVRSNDGGQMSTTAGEVSPEQIDEIVRHFTAQPGPALQSAAVEFEINDEQFAVGQRLFLHGREGVPACSSCHGRSESPAPWLFGQHANYVAKQLRDFAEGVRGNGAENSMQVIAAGLAEEEIGALASYVEAAKLCLRESSENVQKSLENKQQTTCYNK